MDREYGQKAPSVSNTEHKWAFMWLQGQTYPVELSDLKDYIRQKCNYIMTMNKKKGENFCYGFAAV